MWFLLFYLVSRGDGAVPSRAFLLCAAFWLKFVLRSLVNTPGQMVGTDPRERGRILWRRGRW